MKEAYKNRRLAYEEILKVMGKQESIIIEAVSNGVNNFYDIKVLTGLNQDSIKRALNNLSAEDIKGVHNCKRILKVIGSINNPETGRKISTHGVLSESEYNSFHHLGYKQTSFLN